MKKIFFALIILFSFLELRGQESQTEYNFLRLPVSAHAAALGGENITIIEDDPSLMFSNPALASSVSDMTIGLNYMNYMSGANYMGASFTKIVKERATLGVGVQYMNYGTMREFTEEHVEVGTFKASEIAVQGIFSYELARNIVGGITAKFINTTIGNYNSMAVGIDLGVNWYDGEHGWSVSAVAKNLGGQIKAYEEDFGKMPFDLQVGVSRTLEALPLRLSLTLTDLTHYDYKLINHVNLGAEILFSESIWLGVGYNLRKKNEMAIGSGTDAAAYGAGFSVGGGINLERFKLNLAYGKYHAASNSLLINLAYTL
ncbi:MAG: type IX secretion system protein PorQ [Prevotella sp.]|nr:type IX secretion system protein PorQ [Prevotella sp.]MDD7273180.1 type IX secretion system protein PorQ [Prevotellaceae bacterium]MDY3935456.1 type IX secretion system protein PorQ [Prevotella sp.]MDY4218324.1 type IX secretion system protein PorQ [Prevotella sp.]